MARTRGEQDQPGALGAPPGFERVPAGMAPDHDLIEIIHPGATERAIGGRKARRLDDMRLDPETGGQAQDRPGVLGDVGLEKCDPHGSAGVSCQERYSAVVDAGLHPHLRPTQLSELRPIASNAASSSTAREPTATGVMRRSCPPAAMRCRLALRLHLHSHWQGCQYEADRQNATHADGLDVTTMSSAEPIGEISSSSQLALLQRSALPARSAARLRK